MRTKIQGRVNAVLNKASFSHVYGGVKVTCKCEGPKNFIYKGKSYTSLSAAGGAAAKDYGMRAKFVNGWVFWKPERTKIPTVLTHAKPTRRTELSHATPTRRTIESIDAEEVLQQLSELLSTGCEVTVSKDRDRFITRVNNHKSTPVLVQNEAAALSVLDAVGKWKRETSARVKH